MERTLGDADGHVPDGVTTLIHADSCTLVAHRGPGDLDRRTHHADQMPERACSTSPFGVTRQELCAAHSQ